MRTPLVVSLCALCAFGLGFGAGAAWFGAPVVGAKGPVPVAAAAIDDCPPCEDADLIACRAQLGVATEFLEAQQVAQNGTPVPFPEDLPEAYEPATFEANARRAVDECPEAGLKLEFVDCGEYPCLAWYGVSGGDGGGLASCPWWSERYPKRGKTVASGSVLTPDGARAYLGFGETPPGALPDDNANTRIMLRFDDGRARLMDEWDGREPTEEEGRASTLAFWRKLAADGHEGAADMLELLEAEERPPE